MLGQKIDNKDYFGFALVLFTFVGTVLLPSIEFSTSAPKVEISDITFPLLFIWTFLFKKDDAINFFEKNRYWILGFSALILYTVVSIAINHEISAFRDLFEPIKLFKIMCFIGFTYLYFNRRLLIVSFKGIFIVVVVFNVFHYFNIADFNEIIMPFYSPEHHLGTFGLNSIGQPATKRLLGTIGNPNNNAILFLFFTVFFLPREKAFEWKKMLWVSVAILGVILCQSRTGFLALCLILLIYFASQLISWKVILWLIVLVASFLMFEVEVGNDYVASLGDTTQVESAKEGRFAQWEKIIHSMDGYWIQGHGPNKDYFTENNIYAESEYFLVLFRYGIIGILLWISFFFTLVRKYWSHIREYSVFTWYGLLAIFLFTGLTNSPLHAMKVKMVFAIGLGLALILIDDAKKVPFTGYRSKK